MRKKKNDSRAGFKKKLLAGSLGLAAILCLASCGAESRTGTADTGNLEKGTISAQETRTDVTKAQPEETKDQREEPEAQSAIVDGVQFAAGYGIFSAGQPQVYIMKQEPDPIETDGAKAWLLSSLYQDGLFRFLVIVEDGTVTEIPIDKKQGIYGLSSFEVKAGYRSGQGDSKGDALYTITGAGIPGGSFSGKEIWSARDYSEFTRGGSVTHQFVFHTEDMKLETAGPEGSYQINIPGFEDSFSIEFEKAQAYPDAEHIPGMVIKEGTGLMATGEWTKEGLAVTVYTWSDGSAGVTPEFSRLSCEAGGETGEGRQLWFQASQRSNGATQEFLSRMEGGARITYYYEIPEKFREGNFFLESSKNPLTRRTETERSEWLTVPIPETWTELNLTAELEHCTITLISAEKEEPSTFVISGEDGQEEVRPCVSLGVKVTQKDGANRVLQHVRGVQEEEDPKDLYYDRWARGSYRNGKLVEVRAYYKEGDKELRLRFENPEYAWYEAFRLPVQMRDAGK